MNEFNINFVQTIQVKHNYLSLKHTIKLSQSIIKTFNENEITIVKFC